MRTLRALVAVIALGGLLLIPGWMARDFRGMTPDGPAKVTRTPDRFTAEDAQFAGTGPVARTLCVATGRQTLRLRLVLDLPASTTLARRLAQGRQADGDRVVEQVFGALWISQSSDWHLHFTRRPSHEPYLTKVRFGQPQLLALNAERTEVVIEAENQISATRRQTLYAGPPTAWNRRNPAPSLASALAQVPIPFGYDNVSGPRRIVLDTPDRLVRPRSSGAELLSEDDRGAAGTAAVTSAVNECGEPPRPGHRYDLALAVRSSPAQVKAAQPYLAQASLPSVQVVARPDHWFAPADRAVEDVLPLYWFLYLGFSALAITLAALFLRGTSLRGGLAQRLLWSAAALNWAFAVVALLSNVVFESQRDGVPAIGLARDVVRVLAATVPVGWLVLSIAATRDRRATPGRRWLRLLAGLTICCWSAGFATICGLAVYRWASGSFAGYWHPHVVDVDWSAHGSDLTWFAYGRTGLVLLTLGAGLGCCLALLHWARGWALGFVWPAVLAATLTTCAAVLPFAFTWLDRGDHRWAPGFYVAGLVALLLGVTLLFQRGLTLFPALGRGSRALATSGFAGLLAGLTVPRAVHVLRTFDGDSVWRLPALVDDLDAVIYVAVLVAILGAGQELGRLAPGSCASRDADLRRLGLAFVVLALPWWQEAWMDIPLALLGTVLLAVFVLFPARQVHDAWPPAAAAGQPQPWESGLAGAGFGALAGLVPVGVYLYQLAGNGLRFHADDDRFPALWGFSDMFASLSQWALLGFFYTYFYPFLRGRNSLTKAFWTALTAVLPDLVCTLLWGVGRDLASTLLWDLEVLIFAVVLGFWFDHRLAARSGFPRADWIKSWGLTPLTGWGGALALGLVTTVLAVAQSTTSLYLQELMTGTRK
jgi:hypothetical protein